MLLLLGLLGFLMSTVAAQETTTNTEATTVTTETGGTTGSTTLISTLSTLSQDVTGSTTTAKRICGLATDTEVCHYVDNISEQCDICSDVSCDVVGENCKKANGTCKAECVCENADGCKDPCQPNPCSNNGTCVRNSFLAEGYSCSCGEFYGGTKCEREVGACVQQLPPLCPKGGFECKQITVSNYTCQCASGYYLEEATNTCEKVGTRVEIELHFIDTPYSEIYNNASRSEGQEAQQIITKSISSVYTDRILKIDYKNFTQGSLVAHLELLLKAPADGNLENDKILLERHILNCKDSTVAEPNCFDTLGRCALPINGWIATDERCVNSGCPERTVCEIVAGSSETTRCVCADGFRGSGSSIDATGRLVENCIDIDECLDSKCAEGSTCVNKEGGYDCVESKCKQLNCPGSSSCTEENGIARCHCSWIYAGSGCSFPWTLVLLILASILLGIVVIESVFLLSKLRASRSGRYNVSTVSIH